MQHTCVDKFSDQAARAIYAAKRAGDSDAAAALAAGVHRITLARWIRRGRAGEIPFSAFVAELSRIERERLNGSPAAEGARLCA